MSNYHEYCREGAMPHILVNNADNLTLEQHLEVLKRIRENVGAEDLAFFDDTTVGSKNTGCNWGMCEDSERFYPRAEMHTFPKDFDERGRCTGLEPAEGFDCPMRDRSDPKGSSADMSGCFYQCRVFQDDRKTPTRDEALKLYDEQIAAVEKRIQEVADGTA